MKAPKAKKPAKSLPPPPAPPKVSPTVIRLVDGIIDELVGVIEDNCQGRDCDCSTCGCSADIESRLGVTLRVAGRARLEAMMAEVTEEAVRELVDLANDKAREGAIWPDAAAAAPAWREVADFLTRRAH